MNILAAIRRQHDRITPPELEGYPWWLSTGVVFGTVGVVVGAVVQRHAALGFGWMTVAALLVLSDVILTAALGRMMPAWLVIGVTAAGVGVMLSRPVATADIAPMIFTLICAKVTITSGMRWGFVATVVFIGVLVVAAATAGLAGIVLFVVAVLLGFDVGYTFRFQNRVIATERARVAAERERATANERQRIAREIHDLVAHSLSVTMLHVTGARHALSSDGDVAEAIDALREAENVGRQAMADIRRTVGVLRASEATSTAPLPGVDDIPYLIDTVRSAGLYVEYNSVGGADGISQTLGLGLYRITQESLSNIAKHAPAAAASVRLELARGSAHLEVRNALPNGAVAGAGAGLPGMAERARQLGGNLTAGPHGDEWLVELIVPAAEEAQHACLFDRLMGDAP